MFMACSFFVLLFCWRCGGLWLWWGITCCGTPLFSGKGKITRSSKYQTTKTVSKMVNHFNFLQKIYFHLKFNLKVTTIAIFCITFVFCMFLHMIYIRFRSVRILHVCVIKLHDYTHSLGLKLRIVKQWPCPTQNSLESESLQRNDYKNAVIV